MCHNRAARASAPRQSTFDGRAIQGMPKHRATMIAMPTTAVTVAGPKPPFQLIQEKSFIEPRLWIAAIIHTPPNQTAEATTAIRRHLWASVQNGLISNLDTFPRRAHQTPRSFTERAA